jgi:23S rRNA (uracil1939-C5)-methyltransferase
VPALRRCGGCRFQDYAYEKQLEAKEAQVRDALTRLGGIDEPPVEPIVPPPRSTATATSSSTRSRRPRTGRRSASTRGRWDEVLAIEECLLTTDSATRSATPCRLGARGEARGVRPGDADGYLRHLVVREGRNTGQVLVQLVTAKGEKFEEGT